MTIVVQTNSSEREKLDKTLTDIATLTGALREETSIVDPVVVISGATLNSLRYVNYMTIPEFGRQYFITEIRSIRTGLVELSGHVDVLSTYKTQIRANRAITSRQETRNNLYLNDGSLRAYQDPYIITTKFPSGFTAQSYVLAVAGG